MDKTKTGLYFHIPFCKSKCPYCDFYSVSSKEELIEKYVACVCDEIKTKKRLSQFISKDEKIPVDTVYFGGGTPSVLKGEQLALILNTAREYYDIDENAEITVEANPSSDSLEEFLHAVKKAGVNRLSLGMQSSNSSERKSLGRKGTSDSVKHALEITKKEGFSNISLDIMIGVPKSRKETLKDSLDFAINCGVSHISAYILKIEEGTFFDKKKDCLSLPTEDETAEMYLFMSQYLENNGFCHYEISNFCKDGKFSRHNMKYWTLENYIGIGPAAHSFYNGKRFYFESDLNKFINGEKAVFDSFGGDEEEKLMLSLRTYKGISLSDKNSDFIKKAYLFEKNGLCEIKNENLVLTAKGYLISNAVITEFLSVL